MRRILVTGAGGPAGRALVPMLSRRGLEAIPADVDPGLGPAGTRTLPGAGDPAFVPELMRLARADGADLIIPTVGEELRALALMRASACPPPVPVLIGPPDAVITAGDRWLTYLRLREAGLPVPRTLLAEGAARTSIRYGIGRPFISRPRTGRGAHGVRLHHRHPRPWSSMAAGDIIQEFAPGTEYAACMAVHEDPAMDRVVVLEKTALSRGVIGSATAVRRVEAPDVARLALAAARALGLRGPLDLDIRRAVGGAAVVLDVNARFGANLRHAGEVLDAVLDHVRAHR